MTTKQFNRTVQVAIDAKLAHAASELAMIAAYAQACNVDADDMADAIGCDPFAVQQFQSWKIETGRA
jgi:UDP-glucose 6-dehydrogenase